MLTFIIRRCLLGLLTIWALSVIAFAIIQLPPGDFVSAYVAQLEGMGTTVTEAQAEALRRQYGLDQPMVVQYVKWVGQMARGNFGVSLEWQRPVKDLIGERLLLTTLMALGAVLFTWLLAFPIGIYSAVRQYSIGDYVFTFIGMIGLAVPGFLLALILMYFCYRFFDTSIGGLFSPEYVDAPWSWGRVADLLSHLWIPAIVLGMAGTANLIRILRANLLDELRKPYVLTARARGLAEHRVILKYPVRVALNPFISTLGYLFPRMVSGGVIVAIVLSLPTIGPLLYKALLAQDLFLAGTIVMLVGILTVVGTLISDILLVWVDPRIRLSE